MKNKQIVGIDVSKSTLDAFVFKSNHSFQISNNPEGFVRLLEESINVSGCPKDSLFFCFENTGCYSRALSVFLHEAGIQFCAIDALDLKRSMGLSRGKSDKKDAKAIAMYAWRRRDELLNSKLPGQVMDQLSALLSHREMLIKQRTALKKPIKAITISIVKTNLNFSKNHKLE